MIQISHHNWRHVRESWGGAAAEFRGWKCKRTKNGLFIIFLFPTEPTQTSALVVYKLPFLYNTTPTVDVLNNSTSDTRERKQVVCCSFTCVTSAHSCSDPSLRAHSGSSSAAVVMQLMRGRSLRASLTTLTRQSITQSAQDQKDLHLATCHTSQ